MIALILILILSLMIALMLSILIIAVTCRCHYYDKPIDLPAAARHENVSGGVSTESRDLKVMIAT